MNNNNSCLHCKCGDNEIIHEIYEGENYRGYICVCCYNKVKYCNKCVVFHDKNDFINNVCIYELPFYKKLIQTLKDAEILPINYI